MAMPKKRMSHCRSSRRRSHLALVAKTVNKCGHCGEPVIPHRACKSCGYYGGRLVMAQKVSAKKE